jgi:hypothetical protein
MKYRLELKPEYESAFAEYRQDFIGSPEKHYEDRRIVSHLFKHHGATDDGLAGPGSEGTMFRTIDRIRLIDRCIRSSEKGCAGIDMADMMRPVQKKQLKEDGTTPGCLDSITMDLLPYPGTIQDYFPLHENVKLNGFHENWWDFMNPLHKMDQVRDYYGENVAFYWKWIGFMMISLIVLSVAGAGAVLVDIFDQTPNNFTALPFCLFSGVWASFVVHFWRRSTSAQSLKWGALDLEFMKKLKLFALTAVALLGVTGVANADVMLAQDDFVNFVLGDIYGNVSSYCFLFYGNWQCSSRLENFSYCCWSSNWYRIHTLHVHERSMG